MTKTKILIVEDENWQLENMKKLIDGQEDMQVAGVTDNPDQALDMCRKYSPALALIDVVADGCGGGIAAAAEIRQEFLDQVKIVIMTSRLKNITFQDDARKAGADSFIYKDAGDQHILRVIRSTIDGYGSYDKSGKTVPNFDFSEMEIDVILLIGQGKSEKEIGKAVHKSHGSIKGYKPKILDKVNKACARGEIAGYSKFDNLTEFSTYAVRHGIIVPKK